MSEGYMHDLSASLYTHNILFLGAKAVELQGYMHLTEVCQEAFQMLAGQMTRVQAMLKGTLALLVGFQRLTLYKVLS